MEIYECYVDASDLRQSDCSDEKISRVRLLARGRPDWTHVNVRTTKSNNSTLSRSRHDSVNVCPLLGKPD